MISRKHILLVICLLLLAGIFAAFISHFLKSQRQSSLRLNYKLNLKRLHWTIGIYKNTFHRLPMDFEELKAEGIFYDQHIVNSFRYVRGVNGILAYQKKPFQHVKSGKPWGGNGEAAKYDIPSARLVLFNDGSIKFIEEADFQKKYKSFLDVNEDKNNKTLRPMRNYNMGLQELIVGMQWSQWYREKSGYFPDSKWFGAYIALPAGKDL
jgi:hypothetical protein